MRNSLVLMSTRLNSDVLPTPQMNILFLVTKNDVYGVNKIV